MTTFTEQLKKLKAGNVATKTKLYKNVNIDDLSKLRQRALNNATGTINSIKMRGCFETASDYTIIKSGVLVSVHVLRLDNN